MANQFDSVESLLDFIGKKVAERKSVGLRADGTYLANEIRNADPGFRFQDVGLTRLSDAVRAGESRGILHRRPGIKHLEVDLGPRPSGTTIPLQPVLHVAPDIWRAFVVRRAGDDCQYFDTVSRRVMGEAALAEGVELGRFINIEPISDETQKAWAREFIESHSSLKTKIAWDEPYWWRALDGVLRQHGVDAQRSWNRFKTSQVVEYLRAWAEDHELQADFFVAPSTNQNTVIRAMISKDTASLFDEQTYRAAIIDAVRELPLDKLADFAIPVSILRRHFPV